MEERTDAALVRSANEGDRNAFRVLVERHQDRVFGLAFSMLGNRTEAEDVAQEVFLKAYRNLASFRGDARFGTWLYRMAVNGCWDVLRKRRREREAMVDVGRVGAASSPPTAAGDQEVAPTQDAGSVARVRSTLAKMDVDDRAVLRLREIDELPYEEVATVLGVTVEAVKSRLFRARERFREVWHETE